MGTDRPDRSGKKSRTELRENLSDDIVSNTSERGDDLAPFCGPILEGYVNNHIEIHLHANVFRTRFVMEDFCLAFAGARTPDGFKPFRGKRSSIGRIDTQTFIDGNERQQGAVLVDIRQLIQKPQPITPKILPSVVRLQGTDDCLRTWMDAPDNAFAFLSIFLNAGAYRKTNLASNVVRERFSFKQLSQGKDQVVEDRSKIIEAIANKRRDLRRKGLKPFDADDIKSSIRVELIDEIISVVFTPPSQLRLQGFQVLIRSL